jgi:hypothetical protein
MEVLVEQNWLKNSVVEFVGTFALIFVGAGSIIATGGQNLVAIALAHGQSSANGLGRERYVRGWLSWLGSFARRSYSRTVRTRIPARVAACS